MKFNQAPSEMSEAEFVAVYGGVYEHSPWISELAWRSGLHESDDESEGLAQTLAGVVASASKQQQLELILAHPDLAGKAAQAGQLTEDSNSEQAGAGIDQCNADEFEQFQSFNDAYKAKFEFPFIMAIKGSNRHAILQSFRQRLPNDAQTEFREALKQIDKIAGFRLEALAQA